MRSCTKALLAGTALLALAAAPGAQAQSGPPRNMSGFPSLVVASCNTANYSALVGKYAPPTIDTNGNTCVPAGAASSGGSGGIADQSGSNASDAQATSGANQHTLAYEYIYNGATWDRARGANGASYVSAQDTRLPAQTLSAASGSTLVIPLNGAGALGLSFSGLAASGATVTFTASNDGGTTYTAISSFNAASGTASNTYTIDGQTRLDVGGRTNVKLTVTTGGTGNITVGATASPATPLVANTAPLVAQTITGKDIGGVEQFGPWTVTANLGTLNGAALDTTSQAIRTALGSPFQAGGSIANTAFGANQGTPAALANAWPVFLTQAGVVLSAANGLPTSDANLNAKTPALKRATRTEGTVSITAATAAQTTNNATLTTNANAVQIMAADTARLRVRVQNLGTATIYLRVNNNGDGTACFIPAASGAGAVQNKTVEAIGPGAFYETPVDEDTTGVASVCAAQSGATVAFSAS